MGTDFPYGSFDQPDEVERSPADSIDVWWSSAAYYHESKQAEVAKHALDHPSIGDIVPKADPDVPRHGEAADETASEFIRESIEALVKTALRFAADAHGLGPAFRAAELVVEAVQWRRLAEGEGTLEVSVPIPLGLGVELEVTAHPMDDQDGTALGVRFVPSDGLAVGVAQIGRFEVGPGSESVRARVDDRCEAGGAGYSDLDLGVLDRTIEIIAVHLSPEEGLTSRLEGLFTLQSAAQRELPRPGSRLWEHRTELAVLWDAESGRVLVLRLAEDGEAPEPKWFVRIEVDLATGRLSKPDVRQTM